MPTAGQLRFRFKTFAAGQPPHATPTQHFILLTTLSTYSTGITSQTIMIASIFYWCCCCAKNSKFQLPASRVDVIFLVSLSGVFHFSIFATLNNHQQQLAFQQQTGKAVSFGAHIVIFFFPNEHILLGPLATQSTSPMHVVYLSGQQLS
ncbi:hypothetical protein T4C_11895 [Trichinella pseudospiralis]|uniref:Uncharacterized protein n=1 Tax=Trichinella pseudospiralis TaxID=6337 RepID=A0A0V1JYC0_TRIPS|nr:hypothetical protein T4C_11895 [Trichinella pseudospiralis]